MAKKKTLFECQSCGFQTPRWMGKCPNCGEWESLIELSSDQIKFLQETQSLQKSSGPAKARPITEVGEEHFERFPSGSRELDLVLGGGIVPGSLTLIGGAPGIGKSTLLLEIAGNLAQQKRRVLYVSGEESAGQIKLRANRLDANHPELYLLSEINLEKVLTEIEKRDYDFIVVDSIQTLYSDETPSAPGSVTQVRTITFELMRLAKSRQIPIFIIGHITKEGSIAGPRVLEHMVDTVLYFEGDSNSELRLLRGFKNRFGSTNEVGIFEMTRQGLKDAVSIAGKFFDKEKLQAGSALTVIMEGSRPIVIEIQALVAESYGHPRRSSTGYDNNRLQMLLALLEKKLDLPLGTYDVFVNVSGGIRINEPAADLAVIAAILSSYRDRELSAGTVFIGEVSLTGEVREVPALQQRLRELETQGFAKAVLPAKPLEESSIKCYITQEVSRIVEWIFV
ncbi:DNA repair protein RadA [Nitratifractor salsuginis]|uniref:DNA repair protein RadA n=1 Tax=Nitratifractor salsuginis (strain DSM 16511 / JCM 12458 / E9I37-1) TaxID=749222 RepID=E6WZZ5_NITSE|nr:DNA repair protein RadA [Nitratifractor salsuginis]ADV45653.1 DNA repair protein RadA [Nitratifractor salsuginis DSM 16511]